MRFSAVGLRHLGIRVARMAWSSRLLQTALVLVVISVFLTLAQVWAQQRPVMASSLTQPQAPAYSTWQASAETNETTSCDTSTGTSPAPGTQWSKAWRFDSGTDPSATLSSPVIHRCGNYLVVESREKKSTLRGYLLDKAGPRILWELPDKNIHVWGSPWWGGHLVLNHEILDPATGRTEAAPWSSHDWPYVISPHLIITCDTYSSTNRCSAWDWSGGRPTRRWERRYDAQTTPQPSGIAGDDATGSTLVSAVSVNNNYAARTGLMNLADGSVRTDWAGEDLGRESTYIPAHDGWIHIPRDSETAEAYSLQGEARGTFPLSGSNAALLLSESGTPTVEQFQRAYESGDLSWATYTVECASPSACTFNGTPVTLPLEKGLDRTPGRGTLQLGWHLTSDRHILAAPFAFHRQWSQSTNDETSLVIDTRTSQVIAPPGTSAHIQANLTDSHLMIGIHGTEIVGYTPTS